MQNQRRLPDLIVTEGYYDLLRDDDLIGSEHFHVHPVTTGWLLRGEIEYQWPSPHSLTYEYQVTKEWDPVALRTSLDAGEISRRGSVRREHDGWKVAVRDTDGSTSRETLENPGALVDFPSPAFWMAALLRQRLNPDETKEWPVLFVEVPSLNAGPNTLRVRAVPEELHGGEGKQWKGRRFDVTDLGGSAPSTIVAHRCGVVLDVATKIAGATHKAVLTEWSGEFDWPVLW